MPCFFKPEKAARFSWHGNDIEISVCAGYYLRDRNANTFNYKKQAYAVGLDKRFAV
ncbi:hypothetical protein [Photorhabdus temperata]|uniref:hypothetical protein n=1 Tax=Photorhabdus temperata TaxID=574560 RepID=UPI00042A8565|nr:hypothetical protein [Photorhabdus temperata]